jgi:hypothetical protein
MMEVIGSDLRLCSAAIALFAAREVAYGTRGMRHWNSENSLASDLSRISINIGAPQNVKACM